MQPKKNTQPGTNPSAPETKADQSGKKFIELSDGRKAEVLDFKGRHIRQANQMMGDDTSMFIFAMISQCVLIDGNKIAMEELDDMPGKDVMKLQSEFSGINF